MLHKQQNAIIGLERFSIPLHVTSSMLSIIFRTLLSPTSSYLYYPLLCIQPYLSRSPILSLKLDRSQHLSINPLLYNSSVILFKKCSGMSGSLCSSIYYYIINIPYIPCDSKTITIIKRCFPFNPSVYSQKSDELRENGYKLSPFRYVHLEYY